jgi:hypothetical protein
MPAPVVAAAWTSLQQARFRYERENPLCADCCRARDNAPFVDQKANRRREHAVQPGDFPLQLQHDRKRDAKLRDHARVGRAVTLADHDDVYLAAGGVPPLQVRQKRVEWTARQIGKQKEDPAPAVLRQGQFAAADAR